MASIHSVKERRDFAELLVTPESFGGAREREYWAEYEALVQGYFQQKTSPDSDERRYGLQCLGAWPLTRAKSDKNWPCEWHFRFDARTLELLRGDDLLMQQLLEGGILDCYDKNEVVAEIETFIAWLGKINYLPNALSERLGKEIARAKPDFLRAFAESDGEWQKAEDYDAEAAPFIAWLRDDKGWPSNKLLLGRSLIVAALESLESLSIRTAPWLRLDIAACMQYASPQLSHVDLTVDDLRATAIGLIEWLSYRGLLDRFDHLRLIHKASTVPLPAK